MNVKPIVSGCEDYIEIKRLYEASFPDNERHPFDALVNTRNRAVEGLAFYDGEIFCGFVFLACANDIAHIIYFATEEELRGRGYGSEILELTAMLKDGYRIIVDIESGGAGTDNFEQRVRRKNFYLRCGYRETSVAYRWRDEDYEILCRGGDFSEKDFSGFWDALGFVV